MPTKKTKQRSALRDMTSPRIVLRSLFQFIVSKTALKLYLILAVLLAVYVVYLDATISSSFEGKKWQLPARVYARPLEIYQGAAFSADELEAELNDLGYRASYPTAPGNYSRQGNRVALYSRSYTFWDGADEAVQAVVRFDRQGVSGLTDLQGRPLSLLRLEPLEIGAIYPAHKEDRVLLRMEDVPPLLTAALLAVEDHRFYQHHGVAPSAIGRAALQNIKSGGVVQGGSTITQQLVKNYYLNRERTLRRKFTEALMALLLERRYQKEEILQAYLNEVYLGQAGARAIHGFGLASFHYFNQPIDELSVEKLALLIAIVRGPTYYDPWRFPERAIKRRNRVIDAMTAHGLLQSEDADWAKSTTLNLGKDSRSQFVFPAYIDLVRRQLRQFYRDSVLTSDGLKIYTSFDPRVQQAAEQAVASELKHRGDEELEAAVVVTHPSTGEVLALTGGRKPRYAGFNRALDARRSIGSTIKPFVYLTALQQPDYYSLATLIDDSPVTLETDTGVRWEPRNFDRESHGQVPLVTAMAKSYNQATARLGDQLGVDSVIETLRSAGLESEPKAVPSLFIGTTQLSPYQVAGLYQTISSNGFQAPLKAIRSVQDAENQPLRRFPLQTVRAWDGDTNHLISYALTSVAKFGSARGARHTLPSGFEFAGKTGTSGNQRDSWFAGYTGDILAVVWMGYDNNRASTLTGGSAALPVWARLVKKASKQSLQLPSRDDMDYRWIDWPTGMPARATCSTAVQLPFVKETTPSGRKRCTEEP